MLACCPRSTISAVVRSSSSSLAVRSADHQRRLASISTSNPLPSNSNSSLLSTIPRSKPDSNTEKKPSKLKPTPTKRKLKSAQDSLGLKKVVNQTNLKCKQIALQKNLDLVSIVKGVKSSLKPPKPTDGSSEEDGLKIKLRLAEATLKHLEQVSQDGAQQSSDPSQSITSRAPRGRASTTARARSKAPKSITVPIAEEPTLATDALVREGKLDLVQAPEPASAQPTDPDTSFSFSSSSIPFEPVVPSTPQPAVATLAHGLSRVLFNPGVHWLQDPRTLVYNFDHRLQDLVAPEDFNFDALAPYVTSSRDEQLVQLAHENERKYCGSTSSMSQTLSQIYMMLNGNKPLNIGMLTANASSSKKKVEFTPGAKMPASIVLNYNPDKQKYSIDSDKSLEVDTDCPDSTILSSLGHVLEKFFVLPHDRFSRLLKKNQSLVDLKETKVREAYAFAKTNLMMTRSQLDCHHHYLPGNGTFDIKTRATIAVRHDRLNHANAAGYQIRTSQGPLESFEREYLDLIRSAFLKYQFQTRIGQMDGCFVAYHNTQRVFGFEYVPVSKMDQALFGSSEEGDKVFKLCLGYMERILEDATKAYPEQTLRITTFAKSHGKLWMFVSPEKGEPMGREPPEEYTVFRYQNHNYLNGDIVEEGYVDIEASSQALSDAAETGSGTQAEQRRKLDWSVFCQVWKQQKSDASDQLYRSVRKVQFAISQLVLPEGVDRQLMRVANWPETADELKGADEDDISSPAPPAKTHTFVPTPGVKYKTDVSQLVQRLRSMAKDGWRFQRKLMDSQAGRKVVSIKPAEYLVEDRSETISSRKNWQNEMVNQEEERRKRALEILEKGEQRINDRS